jgi:hypothetical protein
MEGRSPAFPPLSGLYGPGKHSLRYWVLSHAGWCIDVDVGYIMCCR